MTFQIIQTIKENQNINLSIKNVNKNNKLIYPIILHHGFAGFDHILNYGYYYNIKPFLEKNGFEVWRTSVTPLGNIQSRTNQLKEQIDKILYCSSQINNRKIEKAHLIAHSTGGIDSRLLISENTNGNSTSLDPKDVLKGLDYGDRIASLTTIACPHLGTKFADWILSLPKCLKKFLNFIFTTISKTYSKKYPSKNHYLKSLYYASETFCKTFNKDHLEPLNKSIFYRAYAGITHNPIPFLRNKDEVDFILWLPYFILKKDPDPIKRDNDGLVPVHSARWKDSYFKTYRGDLLQADHLDQLGHIMGKTDPYFDYLEFYLYLANSLREIL